jgi:hypothetical protein
MCSQAGVSRSGYYSYAARKESPAASARESRDYADFLLVKEAFGYKGRPKGSRTISMMMPRLFGVAMNRKKVKRLMGKYGLECPARRPNPLKKIAKAIQSNTTFSNKLNRQFAVGRPGEHLLTDISYIHYGPHLERLCFLSALKDASTNEIVAWTLSESLGLEFVIEMLRRLDSAKWLPQTVLRIGDGDIVLFGERFLAIAEAECARQKKEADEKGEDRCCKKAAILFFGIGVCTQGKKIDPGVEGQKEHRGDEAIENRPISVSQSEVEHPHGEIDHGTEA